MLGTDALAVVSDHLDNCRLQLNSYGAGKNTRTPAMVVMVREKRDGGLLFLCV